jgi:PAS domain S-box-containing protein
MSSKTNEPPGQKSLRLRALSHITGKSDPPDERINAAGALAVLHELASSPLTAESSLKMLHELQVHQVELDMQEEELRRAVADLESALFRQVQLHDFAPAGFFSVDRSTVLCELNRTGEQLLGFERDVLIGRTLDSFLEPDSIRALHASLSRVADSSTADGCALHFAARDGVSRTAYASVGPDPGGRGFLIVCVEMRESGRDATA